MNNKNGLKLLGIGLLLWQGLSANAHACRIIAADRLFDGVNLQTNMAVLVKGQRVIQVGTKAALSGQCSNSVIDMGDATPYCRGLLNHTPISVFRTSGKIRCCNMA